MVARTVAVKGLVFVKEVVGGYLGALAGGVGGRWEKADGRTDWFTHQAAIDISVRQIQDVLSFMVDMRNRFSCNLPRRVFENQ
jgi:hypothetical protein